MSHTRISTAGQDSIKLILQQVNDGILVLPTEITLQQIGKFIQATPQVVGMSYDDYIRKPLAAKGIASRKCGSPVRIQLFKK
ncbi:MAG: hypothetical protein HY799_00815 [Nitrosomonadales bacterium]|nr:hypothetical protein [Nitrosomonadales bacterium]